MKQTIVTAAAFATAAVIGVVSAAASPTAGTPTASPATIVVNTPTDVTFAAVILDSSVLATGVNLLRTDAAGKTLSIVAVMHDDGLSGDAVAGDKTFSCRVSVNEGVVGPAYYRVSAAFKGVLLRSLSSVMAIAVTSRTVPQTVRIDSVLPAAARRGATVAITGDGFNPFGVTIAVGGIAAQVLAANANQVVFQVPAQAPSGVTQVRATNPGATAGSVGFQVLDGVLLPGAAGTLAATAVFDMPPGGVDKTQVDNGIIMSRIDVHLAPEATVAQVNAALAQVAGGIVSMASGSLAVTIALPRQPSVPALQSVVQTLRGMAGIRFARLARRLNVTDLPLPTPLTAANLATVAQLLPSRFPAAWNAKRLIVDADDKCLPSVQKVPLLVADTFGPEPSTFRADVPAYGFLLGGPMSGLADEEVGHGYAMALTAAAAAGGSVLLGANPFNDCLSIAMVQTAGQSVDEIARSTAAALARIPAGQKVVVTNSQAYPDDCFQIRPDGTLDDACVPPEDPTIALPLDRAWGALVWKEMTSGRWSDFLYTASAGNSRDFNGAAIYAGVGDSRYAGPAAVAHVNDPLFTFVSDATLWNPAAGATAFDSLVASAGDVADLTQAVFDSHQDGAVPDNVIVVGGVEYLPGNPPILSAGVPPESLQEAAFSESHADVKGVGRDVGLGVLTCPFNGQVLSCSGSSLAVPQVAGLASYLWLLSPALPVSSVSQAIVSNAWSGIGSASGLIDAYASVLSLDMALEPSPLTAPVRLAILDVNDDGKFDESDVDDLVRHFFLVDGTGKQTNVPVTPATVDYGRYDLNGDGFTGGPGRRRFDLDRVGSTQFGLTSYSTISRTIQGQPVPFDETGLTDSDILCYYAYSDLYTGDPQARDTLLAGICAPITVTLTPKAVTVLPSGTQAFSATVRGTDDPRVTWSATGGTITGAGLFTAGSTAGSFKVRATSLVDATAFDEAVVTIGSSCAPSVNFLRYILTSRDGAKISDFVATVPILSDSTGSPDSSASITLRYGSVQTAARSDDVTVNNGAGGAFAQGQFTDAFIIVPADPALLGTPASVTVSFRVTASVQVSGDRAVGAWSVNSIFPWQFFQTGRLSTVQGQTSGDVSGGAYSVTAPPSFYTTLGKPMVPDVFFTSSIEEECSGETCLAPGHTGSGSAQASLQWLGMTVRDQADNPIAFSVCSASGTNWAAPQ
jgi:hypothetical protein